MNTLIIMHALRKSSLSTKVNTKTKPTEFSHEHFSGLESFSLLATATGIWSILWKETIFGPNRLQRKALILQVALSRFLNQGAAGHGSVNEGPSRGFVPQTFPYLRSTNLDVNFHTCAMGAILFLVPDGSPSLSSPSAHSGVHALLNITVDEILAATAREDGGPPWLQLLLLVLAQAQLCPFPSPQPAQGEFSASLAPWRGARTSAGGGDESENGFWWLVVISWDLM